MQQSQAQYRQPARRTLSNATSSTSSTANSQNAGLHRVPTGSHYSASIHRSISTRSASTTSPSSYVALMRKQKATVWCDRAQHEDPRILAAQRAAKHRAAMEVAGGHHNVQTRVSSSSQGITGGMRSKIRHHGAVKASTFTGSQLGGAGVPMRLSASEVDEGGSDEEQSPAAAQYVQRLHQRNGSGRSSLRSGQRGDLGPAPTTGYSSASSPNNHSPTDSLGDLDEERTPMPHMYDAQSADYFAQAGGQGGSGDSGSSGERAERFGNIGGVEQQKRKTSEELRRRGSVDDRTMTMSGVRLFVANPDLSD